jgi:E3 ubiquitin-protein ligase DOA10
MSSKKLTCYICQDNIVSEPVKTPCVCKGDDKLVHSLCLEQWLQFNQNCPQCRTPINFDDCKIVDTKEWHFSLLRDLR